MSINADSGSLLVLTNVTDAKACCAACAAHAGCKTWTYKLNTHPDKCRLRGDAVQKRKANNDAISGAMNLSPSSPAPPNRMSISPAPISSAPTT